MKTPPPRLRRFPGILLTAACALLPLTTSAQVPFPSSQEPQVVEQEQLFFTVGDILEMLPVHEIQGASYAWVLTEEQTFLQAGRAPAFRVRFIRPGTYYLHAEITSPAATRVRRQFVMTVAQRSTASSSSAAADATALVTSVPAADAQGRIALARGQQVLTLLPASPDRTLAIDLNTAVDSNGNGDPADDRDAAESFFETDATPVRLWFPALSTERRIAVTAQSPDGSTQRQQFSILPSTVAQGMGISDSPVRILTQQTGDRTVQFSVAFDGGTPTVPVLLRWNFGDGTESLLSEPIHTYADTNEVEVTVTVRNLLTGQEIGKSSRRILPDGDGVTSSPIGPVSSAGASSAASSAAAATGRGGASWLWTILLMLIVFIVSAGIGLLVIILLKKLRSGGTLSDRLASMEQKITKTEPGATPPLTFAVKPQAPAKSASPVSPVTPSKPAAAAAAATQPPKPAPTPAPTPAPSPAKSEREWTQKPADLSVQAATAPSWLKKGLEGDAASKSVAPSPAPAPMPASAPKPAAPVPPAPKPAAPTPAVSTPKPAAAPLMPPAPKPVTQPVTTAAPAAVPAASKPVPPPLPQAPKPATPPAPAAKPASPILPVNPPVSPVPAPEKPATLPAPAAPAPKPAVSAPPAPSPTPKPASPSAISPVPPVSPASDDTPVAFIQVDSLDQGKGGSSTPKA